MATLAEAIGAYDARQSRDVGPFCKRGHERAVYERIYQQAGRKPVRGCVACKRLSDKRSRDRSTARSIELYASRDRHPDTLLWARFCANIEQWIETARRSSCQP